MHSVLEKGACCISSGIRTDGRKTVSRNATLYVDICLRLPHARIWRHVVHEERLLCLFLQVASGDYKDSKKSPPAAADTKTAAAESVAALAGDLTCHQIAHFNIHLRWHAKYCPIWNQLHKKSLIYR